MQQVHMDFPSNKTDSVYVLELVLHFHMDFPSNLSPSKLVFSSVLKVEGGPWTENDVANIIMQKFFLKKMMQKFWDSLALEPPDYDFDSHRFS